VFPRRDWLIPPGRLQAIQTYLERDVRSLSNIGNLETFERFLALCAGRSAQLLNYSGLASDCGVSVDTARRWISVLKTSFIVFLLAPHHRNLNKRLVKSP
jgi:predicted AAA+ superfamily ATPase